MTASAIKTFPFFSRSLISIEFLIKRKQILIEINILLFFFLFFLVNQFGATSNRQQWPGVCCSSSSCFFCFCTFSLQVTPNKLLSAFSFIIIIFLKLKHFAVIPSLPLQLHCYHPPPSQRGCSGVVVRAGRSFLPA